MKGHFTTHIQHPVSRILTTKKFLPCPEGPLTGAQEKKPTQIGEVFLNLNYDKF
jgi:hypothetical protein